LIVTGSRPHNTLHGQQSSSVCAVSSAAAAAGPLKTLCLLLHSCSGWQPDTTNTCIAVVPPLLSARTWRSHWAAASGSPGLCSLWCAAQQRRPGTAAAPPSSTWLPASAVGVRHCCIMSAFLCHLVAGEGGMATQA